MERGWASEILPAELFGKSWEKRNWNIKVKKRITCIAIGLDVDGPW
jgi:hypothetical protein